MVVVEHQLLRTATADASQEEYNLRKEILVKKHAEELKEFDVGIIMKLDQKVIRRK